MTSWRSSDERHVVLGQAGPRELGHGVPSLGLEPVLELLHRLGKLRRVRRRRAEPRGVLVLELLVDQGVQDPAAERLRALAGLGLEGRDEHGLAHLALGNRRVVDGRGDPVHELARERRRGGDRHGGESGPRAHAAMIPGRSMLFSVSP